MPAGACARPAERTRLSLRAPGRATSRGITRHGALGALRAPLNRWRDSSQLRLPTAAPRLPTATGHGRLACEARPAKTPAHVDCHPAACGDTMSDLGSKMGAA